jgi:hypothetical protein
MSYKQLNRDFSNTFPCATMKYSRSAGPIIKRDIEQCIREAENMCLQWRSFNREGEPPQYADVVAIVTHRRVDEANFKGVRIRANNVSGVRFTSSGYHMALLRFAEKPGYGWVWSCPLSIHCDLDLHWKGLIYRDRWQRFLDRLNSVCAEASIFAHAFRHGA